jgi:phosphoglycolate phosphatase
LKSTKHEYTPAGELKPNPKLLLDIIENVGADPNQCVYVGDNLWKDVQMAQDAAVTDVHAEYGTAHTRDEYKLLVAVTHWTDEDVAREHELKEHDVNPCFVLKRDFSELLEIFEPMPFR